MVQKMICRLKKVLICLPVFLLTGCSYVDEDSELYQQIKNQTEVFSDNAKDAANTDWKMFLQQQIFEISDGCKVVAPFVFFGSILIGIFILHLFESDQGLRKKAWLVFIIGIPVTTVLVTYGTAWFAGALM